MQIVINRLLFHEDCDCWMVNSCGLRLVDSDVMWIMIG